MEFTDEETEAFTMEYSAKLAAEIEKNRQETLVRESTKQKLMALGFSPNEIAAILGEEMLDHGSGLL